MNFFMDYLFDLLDCDKSKTLDFEEFALGLVELPRSQGRRKLTSFATVIFKENSIYLPIVVN